MLQQHLKYFVQKELCELQNIYWCREIFLKIFCFYLFLYNIQYVSLYPYLKYMFLNQSVGILPRPYLEYFFFLYWLVLLKYQRLSNV